MEGHLGGVLKSSIGWCTLFDVRLWAAFIGGVLLFSSLVRESVI